MRHRAVRIAARSSLAALACALGTAVWGQAFQGTPQLQSGAATFARATPGAETITVNAAQTVVNWTVTAAPDAGGNIDYLPQGAAATFTAGANVTGFTILNRILPADPASRVAFNGQVTSNVAAVPGGNVWFYSPGGIIVGDTGRFDVGSLLLTTLDPVRDANGAFIDGAGRTVFGPGATGGIVNILSGARIDAAPGSPTTGNYVALLAPIVYQAGTVTVNGSAAYVAAEAATLTIGQGLFDIVVTTGSTDNGFPLQHAGTTTGPASTGAGDAQRIYLVSVPKNDAITLAIAPTARLGFTPATAAGVENGRVVLSAGSNVTAGAPDPLGQASPLSASIRIDGGVFSSPVIGQANTNILAASTTGTPSFAGDLTLAGGNRLTDEQSVVQVAARVNGQTLSVGGTLSLTAQRSNNATADGTGGVASLLAENGGVIRIAGGATIDATGSAGTVTSGGTVLRAGLARGGNAGILARSGGLVDVGGSTRIVADALVIAGNGTVQGGSAAINAIGTGRVSLGDSVSVSAGVRQSDVAINAVTAAGGQAIVNADAGGQVTITGTLRVDSGVAAGFSRTFGLAGPTARGGASFVSATGAGSLVTVNGGVTLDSSATRLDDNDTGLGGASFGGRVSVSQSDSGRVVIVGGADLAADATGGNSARADTAAGAGTGGDARFVANAGAIEADAVTLTANGLGGQNQSAGDGGAGTGGLVNIGAGTGSALVRGAAVLGANGTGGLTANGGATAGAGRGGQALVGTVGSGTITTGGLTASAAGIGGRQAGTALGGTSGAGFGGTAEVFASPAAAGGGAGTIRLASVSLDATGRGGVITSVAGGTGGAGSGGQARVQAGAGGLVEVAGAGELFADGFGGTGFLTNGVTTADRGGTGVGGLAILRTDGGTIELRGDALLEANGFGGFAATGGDGFGGSNGDLSQGAYINALGGRIAVTGRTELTALGSGGTSNAGAGGDGTGGTANISAQTVTANAGGSTIALGEILIDVTGDGGAGGAGTNGGAGAAGGTGLGGNSNIIGNAGNGVLTAAALTVSVAGQGGRGGDGATGGAGGAGTGGFVQLGTASGPALPVYAGRAAFAGVTAIATGQGGDGGTSASGAAAAGGAGIGGTATVIVRGSLVETGDGTFFANGVGGAGGTIGGAVAGVGGQGVGGDATILVTPHATSGAPATGRFGAIVQSVDAVNGAGGGGAAPAFGTGGIVVTGSSATLAALTVSAGGAVQRTSTAFAASTAPGNVGGQVQVTGFDDRGSGIEATNATLAIAGDATLFTGGDVDLFADASSVTIGGRLGVTAANVTSGPQTSTALPANPPPGAVFGFLPGNAFAVPAQPAIIRAGAVSLSATGTIAQPTGLAGAGGFTATAGGGATFGALESGTDLSVGAGTLATGTVVARGDAELSASAGDLATGNVRAGGDADLTAGGAVRAGRVSAGASATLVAGGDIVLAGADAGLTDPAPDDGGTRYAVALDAGGAVTATGVLDAAETVGIVARGGAILTGDIGTDGSIVLLSDRAITTGTLDGLFGGDGAAEAIVFIGGTGNVATLGEGLDPARLVNRATTAFGNGDVSVGAVEAGNFDVATTGSFTAAAGIAANRRIDVEAGGAATLAGPATAARVRIVSADLVLGAAGALGDANTSVLELVARPASGVTVFGGAGTVDGYRLDGAEIGRLRANRIALSVSPVGGGAGDLTIAGFDLDGSGGAAGLAGADAGLTISAPGAIRVTGPVRLNRAAAGDVLALSTPGRLEVATDAGAIGMFAGAAGSGALSGRLALSGGTIAVAAPAVLARLAGEDTAAARAALVNAATPSGGPEGFVQAGAIAATALRGLFVQNSGTAAAAAGFSVGAGGFTVTSTAPAGSAGLEAIVNGRQVLADGVRANGDVLPAITVRSAEGSVGLAASVSGVNGCLFAAASCVPVVIPPERPDPTDPQPGPGPQPEPQPQPQPEPGPQPEPQPQPEPGPETPAVVDEAPGEISAAIRGVVDGPLSVIADAGSPTRVPDVSIQALVDTSRFDTISFIEEPVTGGGNAGLPEGEETQP